MMERDEMTRDEIERVLRDALAESEVHCREGLRGLKTNPAHPYSEERQFSKSLVLLTAGRMLGLAQALQLLTGVEYEPGDVLEGL